MRDAKQLALFGTSIEQSMQLANVSMHGDKAATTFYTQQATNIALEAILNELRGLRADIRQLVGGTDADRT